jgi:hypothetical protein
MSSKDLTFPRLMYRGPASDAAETQEVANEDAYDVAVKAGWRARRVDKKHEAEAPPAASIAVPAQTLHVDPNTVKKDAKK